MERSGWPAQTQGSDSQGKQRLLYGAGPSPHRPESAEGFCASSQSLVSGLLQAALGCVIPGVMRFRS